MKSILALSSIALVISAHTVQADPGRSLDPHEQTRQLILGVTQHSTAIHTTTVTAGPAPTDSHELARRRIFSPPVTDSAFRPVLATGLQPTIDPHAQARRSILGSPSRSESSPTSSSRR
jgi:hypothetical protein